MGCFSAFLQRTHSLFELCGLQVDYEVAEVAPNAAPVAAILLPQQGHDLEISPSALVQRRRLSAFAPAAVIQSGHQHWQRILPSFHPPPSMPSMHDMVELQQSNGQIRLVPRLVAMQAGGVLTGSYRVLPHPHPHPLFYDMTAAPRLLVQAAGVRQQSTARASLPPTLTALPSRDAPSSVESPSLRDSFETFDEGSQRQAYAVDMRCHSSPILFPRGRCGNVCALRPVSNWRECTCVRRRSLLP
jgi:hypothetical protein